MRVTTTYFLIFLFVSDIFDLFISKE